LIPTSKEHRSMNFELVLKRGFKDLLQAVSKQEGMEEIEAKTPKKGLKFEVECEHCLRCYICLCQ